MKNFRVESKFMKDNDSNRGNETGHVYGAAASLIDAYFDYISNLDSIKSIEKLSSYIGLTGKVSGGVFTVVPLVREALRENPEGMVKESSGIIGATVGSGVGAYAGTVLGRAIGGLLGSALGPIGTALGGMGGAAGGQWVYDKLREAPVETSPNVDIIQSNRPGQYLSGWKDGAPGYSGAKYSGGINNNGKSWGLDSPSEHIGIAERSQFVGAVVGTAGSGIASQPPVDPITHTATPILAPIAPVSQPNLPSISISPALAPSFPSQKSANSSSSDKASSSIKSIHELNPNMGTANGKNGGRGLGNTGGVGESGNSPEHGGWVREGSLTMGLIVDGVDTGLQKTFDRYYYDPNYSPNNISPNSGPTSLFGSNGVFSGGNNGNGQAGNNTGNSTGGNNSSSASSTGRGDGTSGREGYAGRPVLLDLAGKGFELSTLNESSHFVDMDGSGLQHRMAWGSAGTGVLVFDADGDGKISQSKEFAFVEWAPTASSDFEALRQVFDTNGNGKLDAGDAQWASFRVSVGDQLFSLDELDITSIDLTPSGSGQTFSDGSAITGTSTYTKSDGTTGAVGDATLAIDPNGYKIEQNSTLLPDGSSVKIIHGYNQSGQLAFVNEFTTSPDGTTRSTRFDDNGDGIWDRSQTIVHNTAPDNSRTKTVSDYGADGSLLIRTVTSTSSDGNIVTTSLDTDGNGNTDQRQVYHHRADGSSVTTTEELSVSGNLLRKVEISATADGLTKTTRLDTNGNGIYNLVVEEITVINPDGSRTRTESRYSANNTLISRVFSAISSDGRSQTIAYDLDGDGVVDTTEITKVITDASGNVSTEVISLNGDGSQRGTASTTLSPDGQKRVSEADLTGDGVVDLITTEIAAQSGSVWTETVESRSGGGTLLSRRETTTDTASRTTHIAVDANGDGSVDLDQITVTGPDGVTSTITQSLNRDGSLRSKSTLVNSEDGLNRSLMTDLNGDGLNDFIDKDDTTAIANGSRTRTVQKFSQDGRLIEQTVTETSRDGLSVITREDINGDGIDDISTADTLAQNADGSRKRTITTVSANGNLLSETVVTQSSDRRSTTTIIDENGDARSDKTIEEWVNTDGSISKVETHFNGDGSLQSKIEAAVSSDRLRSVTEVDSDGDGFVDFKHVATTTQSLDGSQTIVESDYAGTTLVSEATTYVSGNGLVKETGIDKNGDGIVEQYQNDSTILHADGTTSRIKSTLAGSDRSLISQIVTSKSANGLEAIVSVDRDGDGQFDRVTQSIMELNDNGSTSETTTVKNADNRLIYRSKISASADGNSATVETDLDGDGNVDAAQETLILANGSVTITSSTFDHTAGNQKLMSRSVKTVSDDGFEARIDHDTDGNGTIDYTERAVLTINADGSRTETIWREERGKGITEKTIVTADADGLSQTIDWMGADSVSRGSVSRSTTINADGSTIQSERFTKPNGALESSTELATSADKMTTIMTRDVDGDGQIDHRVDIQRQLDGRLVSTYTDFDTDGITLTDRKIVTETADGNYVRVDYDTNGDGLFDASAVYQTFKSTNGDISSTTSRTDGTGSLKDRKTVIQSANGLTLDSRWDFDGDGVYDRQELDITTLNNDGSTARRVSTFDKNGGISSQMESSVSANGLVKATRWNRDGSVGFEQELSDNTVLNGDGTTTRTIESSKDGTLFSKSVSTISADGMSQSVVEEFSGLGLQSRITNTSNSVRSDSAVIETVTVSTTDAKLLESQTRTTTVDGRFIEITSDANGDGVIDQKKTYTQHNDGSQIAVTTGYRSGVIKTYETSTTISANGLRIETNWDEDGNGTVDRMRETINRYNIDGSSLSESTDRSSSGNVLSRSVETVSADGMKRDITRDLNGDGIVDVIEQQQTRIDGETFTVVKNNDEARQSKYLAAGSVYWQNAVAAVIERQVSFDGLSWTERSDFDGNGTFEHVITSERQIDGSVISIMTELNANGSLKDTGRMIESSDGRTRILTKDIGNDGIVDEVQKSVSHLGGSTSWTKDEFSTNGSLNHTTQETINAMGKLTYRLVSDELGRRLEELVFDTMGRSVYSLYDGVTGQLLSETKLDKDGVKTSATLYDPLNKEAWSTISQTYSLGKISRQDKINDDGTTEKITYSQELPWIVEYADPLNTQTWTSIKQTYSGGKLWIQDRINDNGVKESSQYNTSNGSLSSVKHTDTLNAEAWTSISQTYSNGVLTSYDRIWDDGTRDTLAYNAQTGKTASQTYYYSNGKVREKNTFDGQTGSMTGRTLYEADGRVKENTTVYAGTGTRTTTWYDTTNIQFWQSLLQEVNIYGQLTKQETVRDDNSKETWYYDPQNTQTWSSVVWQGNSAWQMTGKITYNDDGSRNAIFWDPSNINSWKEYTQYFNTRGQLKKQVQINDDGTKEYWWWDVDNESPSGGAYVGWNYIYEKHNQAGQIIKKAIQWDYGNWTYPVPPVLLDLNGDGVLDLTTLKFSDTDVDSVPTFDWDGDGISDQSAWVGPNDGLLVIDLAADGTAGADGKIDQAREIAFSVWKTEDARQAELEEQGIDDTGRTVSDLEGLRYAFDTNGDNILDAKDERWSEFRVWRDLNQNGVADAGELMTMDEAGIKLINLLPTSDGATAFADGSAITGTTTAEKTDGSSMLVGDATFSYRPSVAA